MHTFIYMNIYTRTLCYYNSVNKNREDVRKFSLTKTIFVKIYQIGRVATFCLVLNYLCVYLACDAISGQSIVLHFVDTHQYLSILISEGNNSSISQFVTFVNIGNNKCYLFKNSFQKMMTKYLF